MRERIDAQELSHEVGCSDGDDGGAAAAALLTKLV
jgi:hypothetical protein